MSAPPSPPTAAKIRVRGLHKSFAAKQVLRGLDLDVGVGESLVVIGGSGTGKSVLIKTIIGLLDPDSGSIAIDGVEVVGMPRRAREAVVRKFGMLFQGGALDSLPVWENVAFGLIQAKRMPRRQARDIAVEKLAQVGLGSDVAVLSPAELSGGMQKRVGEGGANTPPPPHKKIKKPTTGLDPIMGDVINELIIRCVRHLGATALSITHDMASARKIADRVAMLHGGRIVWQGPVGTIDRADNAFVDQFIHGRAEGPITMELRR
jgi:phospholipid/cholesterol/gamma-HCH transport system ATP-binding protein